MQEGWQAPDWQAKPSGQRPQVPPHPSGPHSFPSQRDTHRHAPPPAQTSGSVHEPHSPPHPSGPHSLPWQRGWHGHSPKVSQVDPAGQVPHVPPQPSDPQARPVQLGVQFTQARYTSRQEPAIALPVQASFHSGPHCSWTQSTTARYWRCASGLPWE